MCVTSHRTLLLFFSRALSSFIAIVVAELELQGLIYLHSRFLSEIYILSFTSIFSPL